MTLKTGKKEKNTEVVRTEAFDINLKTRRRGEKIVLPSYEDTPKVVGIFRNLEYPGSGISFPFRAGWKGPVKQFTFFDGLKYEIPETLAKHLNERCAYKTLKWVSADRTEIMSAKPVLSASMPDFKQEIDKKVHRFMFQITGK